MVLEETIKDIAGRLSIWTEAGLNEAQTSQVIVLRVLNGLGYDIWNPFEVFAQETGNSGIPDFIVSFQDKRRFVVEVKKLGSILDAKTKTQAVSYANNHAIRWAILTNGVEWCLFDSFMQHKQAHDRLILQLSFSTHDPQLLAQYLERLLATTVWSQNDQGVERVALDIQSHIQLHAKLQPLARRLKELMAEFTVQDMDAGLKLAERLAVWSDEDRLLINSNQALFRKLCGYGDEEIVDTSIAQGSASSTELVDALREGIARTRPLTKDVKQFVEIEARANGELLQVKSWRDIHAGIAEALLVLRRDDLLELYDDVCDQVDKGKRRKDGTYYPPTAYRQLSNGRFLFLHWSAQTHRQRSTKLLEALEAPKGIFKVVYKGRRYTFP